MSTSVKPSAKPDKWLAGFAVALAEVHRLLVGGNNSAGIREVARNAGLTLAAARAARVCPYERSRAEESWCQVTTTLSHIEARAYLVMVCVGSLLSALVWWGRL